jgi:3-oxo-5-alpha-steroid 4-dehydrogenase 1
LSVLASSSTHELLVVVMFALALLTYLALRFVVAPYGRHARAGWGPTVPDRVGWMLMESPSLLYFAWIYTRGAHRADAAPLVLFGLWMAHYGHRTLIYPFRLRSTGKRMPVVIVLMAVAFNVLNCSINARWISELGAYPAGWLSDPRFVVGVVLFAFGMAVNFDADRRLFALRAPGETGYKIPRGGLYEWVTSPNYLGELIEWTGWALASWSLGGLAFAVYTFANLAPRAVAHHAWYRQEFPEYPKGRKALVPFLY